MDLSALIFVALAVAWAVYLIPKALKHHDEVVRSRSVDTFSHTMRVLARREPVDRRNARLVVSPVRAALRPPVETKAHTTPSVPAPAPVPAPQLERASARRAARRRRRVLGLVVLANAVVIGLAAGSVIVWPWVAAPAALLVAWLVACRVSVRSERRQRDRTATEVGPLLADEDHDDGEVTGGIAPTPPLPRTPGQPTPAVTSPVETSPAGEAPDVTTGEVRLPGGWDMVPTTLPTYVTKSPAQRRTVSTIDLESTGVWSSGHNDEDSALARAAEQSARAAREADETRRASGA